MTPRSYALALTLPTPADSPSEVSDSSPEVSLAHSATVKAVGSTSDFDGNGKGRSENSATNDKNADFGPSFTSTTTCPIEPKKEDSGAKRTFAEFFLGQQRNVEDETDTGRDNVLRSPGSLSNDSVDFTDYLRTPLRKKRQDTKEEHLSAIPQCSTKSLPNTCQLLYRTGSGIARDDNNEDSEGDDNGNHNESDEFHFVRRQISVQACAEVPPFDPNQRNDKREKLRLEEAGGTPMFLGGHLTDSELQDYEHFCLSFSNRRTLMLDNALEILHTCNYDTTAAKEWITSDPSIIQRKRIWTDQERHLVDIGFRLYGKRLRRIYRRQLQARGSDKTMADMVNLYYQNKHRSPFPQRDPSLFPLYHYHHPGSDTAVHEDNDNNSDHHSEDEDDLSGEMVTGDNDDNEKSRSHVLYDTLTTFPSFNFADDMSSSSSPSSYDGSDSSNLDFPMDLDPLDSFGMMPLSQTKYHPEHLPPVSSTFELSNSTSILSPWLTSFSSTNMPEKRETATTNVNTLTNSPMQIDNLHNKNDNLDENPGFHGVGDQSENLTDLPDGKYDLF